MRLYFSRAEQIVAALLVLAILAALGVLVARQRRGLLPRAPEPLLRSTAAAQPLPATAAAESGPVVHVVGAVKRPGVYILPPNARIQDAVRAAGGARDDGAPDALNLADRAIDGSRIEVPTTAAYQQLRAKQPAPPLIVAPSSPRSSTAPPVTVKIPPKTPVQPYTPLVTTEAAPPAPLPVAATTTTAQRAPAIVHLNTAGKAELETLPSVGPAIAQRILDYRAEHGPFASVDDLEQVKGIGPKALEKIRPFAAL